MSQRIRTYSLPLSENWDDLYTDDVDLVVADEFKGQRRVTWLNAFCDGSVFSVSRRGTAPYLKKKNVPVIILSNYSIPDSFPNCGNMAWSSLHSRFKYVDLTHELFYIWDEEKSKELQEKEKQERLRREAEASYTNSH